MDDDEEDLDEDERLLKMARKLHSKVEKNQEDHITITDEFEKEEEVPKVASKK